MSADIIIVHFLFGLFLFFIINWIGKHSDPYGYISLSIFVKADEAPTFNYLIRILSPVVYLLISASILYALQLDIYVHNFYLVSLYYIIIRLLINLITDTALLLNWYRQIFYWTGIMILSFYTYTKIIINKKNLLPDFTSLSNELWIIILVFIYHIFNKVQLSNKGTIKRKDNYIKVKFLFFNSKYGFVINSLKNKKLIALAYSILIYENFNRPYVVRIVENLVFNLTKKPHTLGVMQMYSKKMINDRTSVELGVNKLKQDYLQLCNTYKKDHEKIVPNPNAGVEVSNDNAEYYLLDNLISSYNTGNEYRTAITELVGIIEEKFFKNNTDKLADGLKDGEFHD